MKYTAKIHLFPDSPNVKAVGTVSADTLKALKENARQQCRMINHHRRRVHLEIYADHMREPRETYIHT